MEDDVRPVQLRTVNTALILRYINIFRTRVCICVLCVIIVYCTFYSVCNTGASDVCAIKITYLLSYIIIPSICCQQPFAKRVV